MNRFGKQNRKSNYFLQVFLPLIAFILLIWLIYAGITSIGRTGSTQQAQSLDRAIHRSIVHCYAVEGAYPESLDYLKENYGITYDESRFYVDYQPIGSNMMPDVTIIDLEAMQ